MALVCKDLRKVSEDSWLWKFKLFQLTQFCDPERYNYNYKACYKSYMTAGKSMEKGAAGSFKMTALRGHTEAITCMDHQNNTLLTGSNDNTAKVWSLSRAELAFTLTGHTKPITCVKLSATTCATGSADATIGIWDLDNGSRIASLSHGDPEPDERVLSIAYNPYDSNQLVSTIGVHVSLWDINASRKIATINVRGLPISSWFDASGRLITSSSENIDVWDVRSLSQPLFRLPPARLVATSKDYLVAVSSGNNALHQYSMSNGALLATRTFGPLNFQLGVINAPPITPATIANQNNSLVNLHITNQEVVYTIGAVVHSLPFNEFALGTPKTYSNHTSTINAIQIDDRKIISASQDNTIKVWDKATATRLYSLLGGSVQAREGDPIAPIAGCTTVRVDQSRVIGTFNNIVRIYNFKL
eukprot:gene14973-17704_t